MNMTETFKSVSPSVHYPTMEEAMIKQWEERNVFPRSSEIRKDGPRYVFFEGPPTANGRPGIHHVLARAFKDMFPRYKVMQGHYGAATRSNDNLRKMKEDIWKIFNHRKGDHKNCPSWCSSTRSDLVKANKSRLPFFCELMKPSFERLADDFLLSKCLHGGTQNANEAFHHLIWSKCP